MAPTARGAGKRSSPPGGDRTRETIGKQCRITSALGRTKGPTNRNDSLPDPDRSGVEEHTEEGAVKMFRPGDLRIRGASLRPARIPLLLVALSFLLPLPADAQYFGRNKVQYDDFDFEVLRTEHFDIHYYSEQEESIQDVARMAERWYERLARVFQHQFRERKPLIFYANQPDFQQTNAIRGNISQATGGVTEGLKNRVILPFAETYPGTDHVLGHELVHAFQFDLAQANSAAGGGAGLMRLPLWSVEGLAEYLSVGRSSSHTGMWMRDAVLRGEMPNLQQLARDPRFFPYRFGHALWAYIGGTYGDDAVIEIFRRAGQSRAQGFPGAVQAVLGMSADTLVNDWVQASMNHFQPLLEGRTPPNAAGIRILPADPDEERPMALGPSVSPDGRFVAFHAQRDLFSLDLFMADARTGEVLGKLASAESDRHLDALAFINSVGSWSPDSRRFAFTVFAEGDNQIAITDAEEQEVVRRLQIDEVGAIFSLAWSPDGQQIAFSGSRGGWTDLYTVHLETGEVRQLTDDPFSELHPEWSPDGSVLAFTTDRGDRQNRRTLNFPPPGIGVMAVETGEIQVFRPLGGAKHMDPAFSPDGRSLFFISDGDGFSDIYRLALETGELRRVTRLATGVSGITGQAPALTVARESGQVLFNVFDRGGYAIHALSSQEALGDVISVRESEDAPGGIEIEEEVAEADQQVDPARAAALPPVEPVEPARVPRYLADAVTGLAPEDYVWEPTDYDGGLQLDFITQPQVGVAVDRFGTQLGGGIAAFFSDMLGDKQLAVATSLNGRLEDFAVQSVYMDRGSRWNWGVQAARIPFTTIGSTAGTDQRNGQTLRTVDLIEFRTILNSVGVRTDYPFSTTLRVEGDLTYTRWSFDYDAIRTYIGPTGRPVDRDRVSLDAPDGFNIVSSSVALVQDNSFFGFTSPVRGSRARFEVEGNTGDLEYATLLGDVRKYFFWNPVTLALQGYHFGRYGGDSEDDRLNNLFLGFEPFVRGYAFRSFNGNECTEDPNNPGSCPEFDRLLGSKMAVGKIEFRVPLIGNDQFGLLPIPFLPTELALFTDAGMAWTEDESPSLKFEKSSTERVPVFSSGVSMRFNFFGALVMEVYGAHPFQRPTRDWIWGFNILPGF